MTLFSGLATLFMVLAMTDYIQRLVRGKTKLNPGTWTVTIITYTIHLITYYPTVQGALDKMLLPYVIMVSIVIIYAYSWWRGKFAPFAPMDYAVMVIAAVAVLIKLVFGGDVANAVLQIAVFISFLPMVEGLYVGPLKDHPRPWILGLIANTCQIALLYTSPESEVSVIAYANPVLIGVGGNLMIAYAARLRL